MITHVLEFDAYQVGDRPLDGVIFLVEIHEHGPNDFRVGPMVPREDAMPYLNQSRINWESFHPDVKERIEENISYILKCLEEEGEGKTLSDEVKTYKEEPDGELLGIQVLLDV